jgi:uncharacterized integral membrane protein
VRWTRRIVAIALFGAALYVCLRFPAQNATPVRVDLLLGAYDALPLWVALLGAFGLGVLVCALLLLLQVVKFRMLARRYRKQARGLEHEVQELRNLPLVGADGPGDAADHRIGVPEAAVPERGV